MKITQRTLQLSMVAAAAAAAGVLALVCLYANLGPGAQQPGPGPLLSPAAGPQRSSIVLTDGPFTFHLQPSLYEAAFPHLQRYQCQEVIPVASLCQGAPRGKLLLLMAIKSHPMSRGRRATLRRTWAQARDVGGYRVRPLFLVANISGIQHINLVKQESRTFEDILLWDFMESHHNLSLKERCFLQWLHKHCQQAAYIFKGDDDLFVNPKALTEYLSWTPNASHFIHGNIQHHSAVMRWGKYAIPHTFYPLAHYPAFASGGGFILPGPFIPALYKASLGLPVFPLDDVYLGFLALAARLPFRHDGRFRVWGLGLGLGLPKDKLKVYRDSLTIHGIAMERIEQVWKELWSAGGVEA